MSKLPFVLIEWQPSTPQAAMRLTQVLLAN